MISALDIAGFSLLALLWFAVIMSAACKARDNWRAWQQERTRLRSYNKDQRHA